MNKGLKVRRGAGSFNKSVMFVTAPSGSTVTMQNMVRSDNLATDVQYQEASAKDQSCVTIKQCGEVSKGDRVKVSLEVTASKDAVGYWASESGLITDKREVNLKSGKQTVTLDITASGNLSLDTKFFCKGDDSDATITAANLRLYKYTAGTTIKTATEKNGVWRFNGLDLGLWLIKAEKDDQTPATQEFEIKEFGVYRTSMAFFAATIKITYPGGSTCTCSKDDRTYTAPDTSGAWDCVVDSAGDWTVTITADGEEPVSTVVTITDDGQTVSIAIAHEITLYDNGDQCSNVTGGWKVIDDGRAFDARFDEDSIVITCEDYSSSGAIGTNNKIDRGTLTTLCADFSLTSGSRFRLEYGGTRVDFPVGNDKTVKLDIANTNNQIVKISHESGTSTGGELTIKRVYIAKGDTV